MLGFNPLGSAPIADDGDFSPITLSASADLSAQGSATFLGGFRLSGLVNLSGEASVSYVGRLILQGNFNASAEGTSVFSGGLKISALSAMSGQGSATFVGGFKVAGASDIQAEGIFSATPRLILGGRFAAIFGDPIRQTEDDDTRITESGDVRIAENVVLNAGTATLIADPTYIQFNSLPYVKASGVWETATIYAKFNGQWVESYRIYQRISGTWRRIN